MDLLDFKDFGWNIVYNRSSRSIVSFSCRIMGFFYSFVRWRHLYVASRLGLWNVCIPVIQQVPLLVQLDPGWLAVA